MAEIGEMAMETMLNEIPKDERFPLIKIDTVILPHPYMITSKHLKNNGDNMYLDVEAAEKRSRELHPNDPRKWAVCEICKKQHDDFADSPGILPYSEHKKVKTLFIQVPQNKDINKVVGLKEYMRKIKPKLAELKIEALPTEAQVKEEERER
jgi:hypothetical protein